MPSNPTIAGIIQFFAHGGPFMVLLVLLSILSVTSIILRARRLRVQAVLPSPVAEAAAPAAEKAE